MEFFDFTVGGNTLQQIILFFSAVLAAFIVGKITKTILLHYQEYFLRKHREIISLSLGCIADSVTFFFLTLSFYYGSELLALGKAVDFVHISLQVLITLAIAHALWVLVEVPNQLFARLAKKTDSKLDDMLAPLIGRSLRTVIVVFTLIHMAQHISGRELGAILASLGIGGLAVALAAQDTIKNFFGSMVILFDKPFELGDRISVDGFDGPVQEVRLRSTRIRTLEGHLVTIPNGEMANKSIRNIAKRPHIRNILSITVTYDTPLEKMRQAKAILEDIFKDHQGMRPDYPARVYFKDFNDASLGFFIIYWFHPPAYWDYLAFTEQVNFAILERFNEAGIEFAFPTQTLYLAGDPNRPLNMNLPQ